MFVQTLPRFVPGQRHQFLLVIAPTFVVEKAQIRMPQGPLKIVGDHAVSVALHTDVVVEVTVAVLGEHA